MIEMDKQKFITIAKFGVVLAACALALPVVVYGALGLVGIFIAGGIGLVGINAAPVIALKLANAKYRALDAERVDNIVKVQAAASENPIETLQLEYDARLKSTDRFKAGITEFRTEIKNYQDQVKQFETEYPDDAKAFKEQLNAMMSNLQAREEKYKAVQTELIKFDNTIKRMRAMYKMALATQKMNKLAGMNTGDEFARIKTEAAVDSVMSGVNKAFAEMETEMMVNKKEVQKAQLIENNSSPVLELETNVKQKASV